MQEEGANFLAEKAGGVPFVGGMLGGAIKSQMLTATGTPNGATATETEITQTMQTGANTISLPFEFSKEEIVVLHKIITEFAAKRHIQLAEIPSAHESNEIETAASPQAMVRAKKVAAKRKIDEVESEVAETTVDAPPQKRRRTPTPKHVEPETVEAEPEPAVMPVAAPTTAKKLNARQRKARARALALEAEAETQPEPVVNDLPINAKKQVQRKKVAPVHASEPEVAESTAVEIAPKITQAKRRKARKTPEDSEESHTVETIEAPTKRRYQPAPKPLPEIAEIDDSSTSALELLNNATQPKRRRRRGAGAKAASVPVAEEDATETEEMPIVKKTNFGKRKRE